MQSYITDKKNNLIIYKDKIIIHLKNKYIHIDDQIVL